jgi:TatD DNase family protein
VSGFVDIHTHLTDQSFDLDRTDVLKRCEQAGMAAVVCNGVDPQSNRAVLDLRKDSSCVRAALGIYPVDAVCESFIPKDYGRREAFDVKAELKFIEENIHQITALGECGLDAHWVPEDYLPLQEKVFEAFIELSLKYDKALIIHSRKCEQRVLEMLDHYKVKRVDLHCFSGRTKWAISAAEKHGWCFSIPCNAQRNEAFQKMLRLLPPECVLTETDAPYLGYEKGVRSEPSDVRHTVKLFANLRGIDEYQAKDQIWQNYKRLVGET